MKAASSDASGSNTIHTLDDVRTGRSKYVTIASASIMKGRWYCIGTVTYTSPTNNSGDGQTHTLTNVVGYIHDTGCAFNGTCCPTGKESLCKICGTHPEFCNGKPNPQKMDVPVGNFTGWGGLQASQYVQRNTYRIPSTWQQIAGLPDASRGAAGGPCGGVSRETGIPSAATYVPTQTGANPPFAPGMQVSLTSNNGDSGVSMLPPGAPQSDMSYYFASIPQQPQSPVIASAQQQTTRPCGISDAFSAIINMFNPSQQGSQPCVGSGAVQPTQVAPQSTDQQSIPTAPQSDVQNAIPTTPLASIPTVPAATTPTTQVVAQTTFPSDTGNNTVSQSVLDQTSPAPSSTVVTPPYTLVTVKEIDWGQITVTST